MKISTEHVSHTDGSLPFLGMLRVVFNIEAGNDYSKSTFIMTLIKQEKLVFILVILYIQEYLCVFTIFFRGIRVSEDFKFRVSGSRDNRKRRALLYMALTQTLTNSVQHDITTLLKQAQILKRTNTFNIFLFLFADL